MASAFYIPIVASIISGTLSFMESLKRLLSAMALRFVLATKRIIRPRVEELQDRVARLQEIGRISKGLEEQRKQP
jgi:hypothetical protein